jgi:hypothetical protein
MLDLISAEKWHCTLHGLSGRLAMSLACSCSFSGAHRFTQIGRCMPPRSSTAPDPTRFARTENDIQCPAVFSVGLFTILAVLNIVSDLAILVPLLFIISALRLQRLERVSLIMIISIGVSSIIASVVRLTVIGDRLRRDALSWDTVHIYFFLCILEIFCGMVAFMLPSLRAWFLRVAEKWGWGKSTGSSAKEKRQRRGGFESFLADFTWHSVTAPKPARLSGGTASLESGPTSSSGGERSVLDTLSTVDDYHCTYSRA